MKQKDFKFGTANFKYDHKTEWVHLNLGKQKTRIKKTDLWMMVFMMTKDKKQKDDLISEQDREMMQFVRQHQVRATKDIKEGELMIFNCKVNVPLIVVDSIVKKEGLEMKDILLDNKLSPSPSLLDIPKS